MSKSQVAIPENKTVALGEGNREEEIEETEETTLSERHKDLGHTKISEKKATFDSTINKSIVEDNRSQQVHSTKNVMQSENVEVSENKKFNPGDSAKAISTEVSQTPLSNLGYGALEPLKSFEPLKPFAPLEFDVPTSFELVKNTNTLLQEDKDKYAETQKKLVIPEVRIDSPKEQFSVETNDRVPESNMNIFAELGYVPVQPLAPLDINTLFYPVESQQNTNKTDSEIKDGNIRNSLKEIISDLDNYVEKSESLVRGVDEGYSRLRNERDENAPPKPVNLEKIFTPADGEQIKPTKSRKVFASSAFYEKGFHPTVEDQIKLAHRISSSLSDISNKSSKGQSMYVKRMKRSVKWVHEGEGRGGYNAQELLSNGSEKPKDPLKLVMNPHGQVHDINSLRKQGFNVESALSPEIAQEIVRGLNSPKGKGAELFAKRRKRSEKWVVGETNGTRQTPLVPEIPPTPVPQISLVQPPANTNLPPPSYLPETVERLQHKQKLDDIQNKFNRPRVKLIKSPWDAALETGSVDAAFVEEPTWPTKGNYVAPAVSSYETALKSDNLANWAIPKNNEQKMYSHNANYNSSSINKIIDSYQKGVSNVDVYKPTMPQGWATHKQFGSNTLPRTKSKSYEDSYYKSPTPIIKETAAEEAVYDNYQSEPNYEPSLLIRETPKQFKKLDLSNCQNYNVAPRAWNEAKNCYKPIGTSQPREMYSDF
ncbi:unnamed protein product [Phyllotreta striolata]|uniref:Uncharacterized protein n=1 Tax=Phyllotreta striolata TaxID=444603 RepID=A0A9N9TKC0_PHYSR|nr:unnamed protein product [Phyllotreta striolata]